MEQLYVFGTGHAAVTRCYNTCFAIKTCEGLFMTDAGGGNGILPIIQDMHVNIEDIHHIFVSHNHTDHILGVVWLIRMIASRMMNSSYKGNFYIYCHRDVWTALRAFCLFTLQADAYHLLDDSIRIIMVKDKETQNILGHKVTFFDIHSTKMLQFGFTFEYEGKKKLTFCGDEPLNPSCEKYAKGSDWLLHEAFCRYEDRDLFKPYEKHHSTVKDACELAEKLSVKNLVLWHTEDNNLERRKELYIEEGKNYYSGSLFVPNDKEIIDL